MLPESKKSGMPFYNTSEMLFTLYLHAYNPFIFTWFLFFYFKIEVPFPITRVDMACKSINLRVILKKVIYSDGMNPLPAKVVAPLFILMVCVISNYICGNYTVTAEKISTNFQSLFAVLPWKIMVLCIYL